MPNTGGGFSAVIGIFVGITVVAIVAVILSKNSNTPTLVSNIFGGFTKAISAAVAPVSGGGSIGSLGNGGLLGSIGSSFAGLGG
jgi:hypothetical protein